MLLLVLLRDLAASTEDAEDFVQDRALGRRGLVLRRAVVEPAGPAFQAGTAPGTPSAISNVASVWTGEAGASTVATARKVARQRSSSTSQRT